MKPEYRHEVLVCWSDEDAAFLAEVPELAGCIADGATFEEPLDDMQVAIRDWIGTARELGRSVLPPEGRRSLAAAEEGPTRPADHHDAEARGRAEGHPRRRRGDRRRRV